MIKKTYSEKLKDPRWQKKRLEILNRDCFYCQKCFDSESTLHVHHRVYLPGRDPWDAPNEHLITLCETCHTEETENMATAEAKILQALKEKFFSHDIESIAKGLKEMEMPYCSDVVASEINHCFSNEMGTVQNIFFTHLNDKYQWQRSE